jgi:outer membrane protein OmpA-like peptidoglycan-associated protein
MNRLTKAALVAATVIAGGLSVSACATEDYVDKHVAAVSTRLDSVQSEVSALSSRVDGVDRTAQGAMQAAQRAQQSADAARALAATKVDNKFAYTDQGTGAQVFFDSGKATLTSDAQATLTALAEKLKGDNKNVYLEIVGYADPRAATQSNRELGRWRGLNVQRFLYDQGIPLSRMNVVSWGEEKVGAPAKGKKHSKEELQQERRVDVIVKG